MHLVREIFLPAELMLPLEIAMGRSRDLLVLVVAALGACFMFVPPGVMAMAVWQL